MSNSSAIKVSFTVFLGFFAGAVYLLFAPFIFNKPLFAALLPAAFLLLLILVIKPEAVLMGLLLFRATLDPFLEMTRVNLAGQEIGLGAVLNLAVILLFFIFLGRASSQERREVMSRGWIFFLLFSAAAVFYSPVSGRAFRMFLNFVSYFGMAMLPLLIIKTDADKKFWQKIMLTSIFLTVMIANVDLLRGGHFYVDAGKRIGGSFTHPNILAFYLILATVFVIYVLREKLFTDKSNLKRLLLALMVNMFILILATKTRNAWLALWVMFFLYGFLGDKRVLFAALVLPPLMLLIPDVNSRVMDLFASNQVRDYQGENSFSWRVNLWIAAFPTILQSPVFGHGLNSFIPLSVNFFESPRGVGAHNVYVEVLFEMGLAGLLSYLAIFTGILSKIWQTVRGSTGQVSKKYLIVFVYVISYLVINVADNMLYYLAFNWYFWFFIGLTLTGLKLEIEAAK